MKHNYRDAYIWRAQNLDLYWIIIDSTDKHYFTDIDWKQYLDFLSSASSLPLWYNNDRLLNAYISQAKKAVHTCTVYTFTEIVWEYAKKLSEISNIENAKIMFWAFGSDAIDWALKCAQTFTWKKKVIAFKSAYHWWTYLSLSSNWFDALKQGLDLPDLFYHLSYPTEENYEEVLEKIEEILKTGEVWALLMETILWDWWVFEPSSEFLSKVKELLHKNWAILIFDEIQTWMWRTWKFWAFENYWVTPDLFVAAKWLGWGYASLSAVIWRADIIDSLNNCQNAFTFSAHAASCAVWLETINIIEDEKLAENALKIWEKITSIIYKELENYDIFKEVRWKWLMIWIALDSEDSIWAYIWKICLDKWVYVWYYGHNNNVVRIQPHLNISEEEAIKWISKVIEAIKEFSENKEKYMVWEFKSFFSS
jgi:4-aminobutyrate aminotransferase